VPIGCRIGVPGLACGAASDVASALAAMRQHQRAARRRVSRGRGSRIVPAIVFHGDQDTTVHPHNDHHVIAQLREALNIDLQATVEKGRVPGGRGYSRILHRDAGGQAIFEQWVIHGAGHAWSGGSPCGSYTDPQGPDATRESSGSFSITHCCVPAPRQTTLNTLVIQPFKTRMPAMNLPCCRPTCRVYNL
jgi:poly(3-hydroxybutyrate) depolymerase